MQVTNYRLLYCARCNNYSSVLAGYGAILSSFKKLIFCTPGRQVSDISGKGIISLNANRGEINSVLQALQNEYYPTSCIFTSWYIRMNRDLRCTRRSFLVFEVQSFLKRRQLNKKAGQGLIRNEHLK